MRATVTVVALISALVLATGVVANAFTMPEKVVVADKLVLVARAPAGGLTAEERIAAMNDRLAPILGFEILTPENIRLARSNGELGIFVGDKLLTTVTAYDARANGTTVPSLAHVWLNNARSAIPWARPCMNVCIGK